MGTIESVQAAVPWKNEKKTPTTHAKRGTKKRRRSSLVSSGHCGFGWFGICGIYAKHLAAPRISWMKFSWGREN